MKEILSKLKKEREDMTNEKKKYDTKMKQITKDLEDENEAVMKELHRIHDDKMKNLASIQESHSTLFDNFNMEISKKIDLLEERITEHHGTLRQNSFPAVINLSKRNESLPEFYSKPEIPKPPEYAPGDIQGIVASLGKYNFPSDSAIRKIRGNSLKLTAPTIVSKFKCPLQGGPSICITKEGDVWLGGHESRELVMVDITGQVLRRRKIQNRPVALAVMDCGDVIISPRGDHSRSVSTLLRDGTEQHVYKTSPYYSIGVSVTADQNMLICIEDGRVVRINSDGTNVIKIYKSSFVNSAIHAIENADGNIYISVLAKRAVVMMSRNGKVLSKMKQTEEGQPISGPTGLVVDKMDNTLCSDEERHVVYIINQKQHMKESIGESFGLQYPQWMAVDNDNKLWITQRDGSILVVKYLV